MNTVRYTAFDNSDKLYWFMADIQAMMYMSVAAWALEIFSWTTCMKLVPGYESQWHRAWEVLDSLGVGQKPMVTSVLVIGIIVAFAAIFIGRWNPMVIGPKRPFRYLCRWL